MLRKSRLSSRPAAQQPFASVQSGDLLQYSVLYYKSKNKVHKSKGVSKMDGVLKLTPSSRMISLTTTTGAPVVATRRETDISPDDLYEDAVVKVGAYQVEIGALLGAPPRNSAEVPMPKAPLVSLVGLKKSLTNSKRTSLQPKKYLLSRKVSPVPTASIPSVAAAKSSSQNSIPVSSSQQRLLPAKRGLPQQAHPQLGRPRGIVKRPLASLHKRRDGAAAKKETTEQGFPGAVGTIDIPHSIRSALKPHQRTGLVFLWNSLNRHPQEESYRGGAILADEMGMGKTLMTIATICALYRQRREKKYIIVCPSSLVSNWAKEFDKWLGSASQPKRLVVKKGGEEGLHQIKVFGQANSSHHSVLILSYDIFRRNVEYFQGMSSRLLVVDEGHRLKNTAGSLTLTALESLHCESRLLLTATPIQNVLSDFYTIANFCNPGILGELADFRRDFERPITAATNKNCSGAVKAKGAEQSRELEKVTKSFMLRRLQKDVLKSMLPPRTEVMLFCRPSPIQATKYQEMTALAHGEDALTTLTNLRKLCLHPDLVSAHAGSTITARQVISIVQSGKLAVLDNLLTKIRSTAQGDKVVIVSNFTSALSLIQDTILKPRGLSFVRLDGSTKLSNRHNLVDTFNKTSSEQTFCFLLSSKAGGCGLNLIGANRLIMVDPDWNPASDIQAMGRVYRQGQEKPCTIYRFFTSGTIEEVICQRQMQKGNLASQTADSKRGSVGFSTEELKDCFTLKNVPCDTKTKLGKSWPNYKGAESIAACGCNDTPLLQLASSSLDLAFVHVVDDDSEALVVCDEDIKPSGEIESDEDDGSMAGEEEWQDDGVLDRALESASTLMEESSSRDDENEFE